jgi:hypothetical protein
MKETLQIWYTFLYQYSAGKSFCLQYSNSSSWNGLVQVVDSLAELHSVLPEEIIQVVLEMLEVGIGFSVQHPKQTKGFR